MGAKITKTTEEGNLCYENPLEVCDQEMFLTSKHPHATINATTKLELMQKRSSGLETLPSTDISYSQKSRNGVCVERYYRILRALAENFDFRGCE